MTKRFGENPTGQVESKKEKTSEEMQAELENACEKIPRFRPEDDDLEDFNNYFENFKKALSEGTAEEANDALREIRFSFEYLKRIAKNPFEIQAFYDKVLEKYREENGDQEMIEYLLSQYSESEEVFFEKAKLLYAESKRCLETYLESIEDRYLKDPKILFFLKQLDLKALSVELERREKSAQKDSSKEFKPAA